MDSKMNEVNEEDWKDLPANLEIFRNNRMVIYHGTVQLIDFVKKPF